MFYWMDPLNADKLFQGLGGWRNSKSKRAEPQETNERESLDNKIREIDDVLFRVYCAYVILRRVDNHSNFCIKQYETVKSNLLLKDSKIRFWSPTIAEITIQFSAFVSALKYANLKMIQLAVHEKNPNVSVSMSLQKTMTNVSKKENPYNLDTEPRNIITDYWNNYGKKFNEYRTLDQHYFALVDRSFLQLYPKTKLIILLPDNPEIQSGKKLTFTKEIDAMDYFKNSFDKFHEFTESLASYYGFSKESISHEISSIYRMGHGEKTILLYIQNPYRCSCTDLRQKTDGTIYAKINPPAGRFAIFPDQDPV